ncbi:MAG: cytochrome P450 [Alphaproteobacteria bacterium]|nr:cytochrome P450 [Alphaproteobacteria bacterium]
MSLNLLTTGAARERTGGCPFHRALGLPTPTRTVTPSTALSTLPRAATAPLVRGLPGIGSGLQLLRDPYGWWPRQLQTHGPVFRVRLPIEGGTWIALAGREANELLAKEGHRLFSQAMTYPKAEKVLKTPLHPSITEGDLQQHLRRQVAPGFSRQAAAPHLPQMLEVTRAIVDQLEPGRSFNVTEWTSRLGLNAMSIFATGQPLGHDTDGYRQYATVFTGVIAMSWPMAMMRLPTVRRTREGLDAMIARRLAEHAAVPPGEARPPDYFDSLLRGTLPDGSPLPDRVRVVYGQIPFKNMGVYAGRVLNHVLYQLVKHPEVLARVLPEIDRVLGADEVTLESLGTMEVFKAAIKETLRLLPIAVAVQRTVCEPFTFGGYQFEVGDRIFFPISATHFLPEHFPDPERFDVDRFLDGGPDVPRHVYNPFGVGHHSCVARGLFESITLLTVGTILQRRRLEAPYTLRTIVDALPGPWPWHRMDVRAARAPEPVTATSAVAVAPRLAPRWLALLGDVPEVRLEEGATLFHEGDDPDRVYVVVEGMLRVHRTCQGRDTTLAGLGAGQVVGEIGILQGVPRTASVTATVPTRLLAVDADRFVDLVTQADLTASELADAALRRHACTLLAASLGAPHAPEAPDVGRVEAMTVGPEHTLLRQGEAGDHAFLLVEGAVEVVVTRPDGSERVRTTLQAPDLFGEIALLQGCPRSATVRTAREGARLLRLDRAAFEACAAQDSVRPELAWLSANRALRAARTLVDA